MQERGICGTSFLISALNICKPSDGFNLAEKLRIALVFLPLVFMCLYWISPVKASDHSDTPLLVDEGRNDARITDLYVFTREEKLILIMCIDPSVPVGAVNYEFPSDVEYKFNIDNDTDVHSDGTLADPKNVHEDLTITVRFREDGTADVKGPYLSFFAGPRDDPFIRGPRIGRNVAAMVVEVPLNAVIDESNTIVVWATAKVDGLPGKFQERFGSPFNSQILNELNTIEPKEDIKKLPVEQPDVTVINTALPSGFPNGRTLEDDVVDLVCPGFCDNVIASDAPFPSENDVPFLPEFPYLSPPH